MSKESRFSKLKRVDGGASLERRSAVPILPRRETKARLRQRSQ